MAARVNPRIIVQSDWDAVLREADAKCWVTYRHDSPEESIRKHGDVKCMAVSGSGRPYLSTTEGFNVNDITQKTLNVSYTTETVNYQCKFQAPIVSFSTVHNARKSVTCLDVTDGGLAVSCDTSANLKVWTTHNGEVRRHLEGHYGDVYSCRFFPSGLVILTGGADTQLKIWSAETGKCAATLTGHKAGITDTSIVDRGRNVVSTSRDGSAKLWSCGQQTCIGTISDLGGVVNGCSLGQACGEVGLGTPDTAPGDHECMTEGKLLLVAMETGDLHGYGLHSRKQVFTHRCDGPVNCCSVLSDTLAVCGTDTGSVYLFDLRNTSSPVEHIKESRSAILSLLPYQQGVFASTGDGSCFYINKSYETSYELSGPDCDPVYKAVYDGTHVYTACRDGLIRKYKLNM